MRRSGSVGSEGPKKGKWVSDRGLHGKFETTDVCSGVECRYNNEVDCMECIERLILSIVSFFSFFFLSHGIVKANNHKRDREHEHQNVGTSVLDGVSQMRAEL